VPEFKRYKGEVRDALIENAWQVANAVAPTTERSLKIGLGLRGSVMYGGSAIGSQGGVPRTRNSWAINESIFYPFFEAGPETRAPAPEAGETPAPATSPSP